MFSKCPGDDLKVVGLIIHWQALKETWNMTITFGVSNKLTQWQQGQRNINKRNCSKTLSVMHRNSSSISFPQHNLKWINMFYVLVKYCAIGENDFNTCYERMVALATPRGFKPFFHSSWIETTHNKSFVRKINSTPSHKLCKIPFGWCTFFTENTCTQYIFHLLKWTFIQF